MQIVTGKCKPVQTTLRQMGAACNKAAVLLTFQRSLCVEEGILMLTWYEAISEVAVQKLVLGKWNTAGGVGQQLAALRAAHSARGSVPWIWNDQAGDHQPITAAQSGLTVYVTGLLPEAPGRII